ncbi:acyl-CoA desaturase [Acinetobacter sp. MD2]|uniref:fatty acid desaturase family protein n=1 Tax=Acinetobacter sp. MD2 TaxID=2600066 RepID=UPI002D1F5C79|nr:acyl-CoA desaturase [Acinetobacter sp. MD2]MEB3766851.1 acyl-CoA desaturase [Acinetobacter sp. MD2]
MKSSNTLAPLRYLTEQDAAFHKALIQQARCYLEGKKDHRYANQSIFIKNALVLTLCVLCYVLSLNQHSIWLFSLFYFGFMCSAMFLNINVLHDASHNAFFKSRRLNWLACRLVTLPLGIDADYWRVRHVDYHHFYPNIEHYDLDSEENGVIRQMPFQKWYPHMRYQYYYWPVVAALSLPYIAWIFDWSDRLDKTPLAERKILANLEGWLIFLSSKVLHFVVVLIVPMLFLTQNISWGAIFAIYFVSQMVASLGVVFLLLGTHWAETEFYQAPVDGKMPQGWYAHNFATACDWQPSISALNGLFGGLNLHLTHHLFPNWNHRHYAELAKIVAQLAQEHGYDYRCIGYKELLKEQKTFLTRMGQKP